MLPTTSDWRVIKKSDLDKVMIIGSENGIWTLGSNSNWGYLRSLGLVNLWDSLQSLPVTDNERLRFAVTIS